MLRTAPERDVEEAHDDPGPGSQILQLQGAVQVDKVRIAKQDAHGGLLHAHFLERVLILGVADDQRHLSTLCRPGERSLGPHADRGHHDPKLEQLLEHAHPEPVVSQQDDATTRARISSPACYRIPSSTRFGRIPRSNRP